MEGRGENGLLRVAPRIKLGFADFASLGGYSQ